MTDDEAADILSEEVDGLHERLAALTGRVVSLEGDRETLLAAVEFQSGGNEQAAAKLSPDTSTWPWKTSSRMGYRGDEPGLDTGQTNPLKATGKAPSGAPEGLPDPASEAGLAVRRQPHHRGVGVRQGVLPAEAAGHTAGTPIEAVSPEAWFGRPVCQGRVPQRLWRLPSTGLIWTSPGRL